MSFHACLHWLAHQLTAFMVDAFSPIFPSSHLSYPADAGVFPVVFFFNSFAVLLAFPALPIFELKSSTHFLIEASEKDFVSSERSHEVFGPYDFGV